MKVYQFEIISDFNGTCCKKYIIEVTIQVRKVNTVVHAGVETFTMDEKYEYDKLNFIIYEILGTNGVLSLKAWGKNQYIQGLFIENGI